MLIHGSKDPFYELLFELYVTSLVGLDFSSDQVVDVSLLQLQLPFSRFNSASSFSSFINRATGRCRRNSREGTDRCRHSR